MVTNMTELTRPTSDKPLVELTPAAVTELKRLLSKQDDPELGVRLGVRGGGCAGYSYDLRLDKPREEKDRVWEMDGVRVMVDRKSLLFLVGTRLDYSDDLLNGGFKYDNPNVSKSCGCGTSFSV
ncbi:MAG TPA: iron-sulfur cluster assembly accessory protein [Armatimonadota bacterium]|nr:iron-sulfur cluster assembly accessory protein [Armatimonadota bacterium]